MSSGDGSWRRVDGAREDALRSSNMQNDSETVAAGLAQGLHTIWKGKGKRREDEKEREWEELNLLLEFGVNHQDDVWKVWR